MKKIWFLSFSFVFIAIFGMNTAPTLKKLCFEALVQNEMNMAESDSNALILQDKIDILPVELRQEVVLTVLRNYSSYTDLVRPEEKYSRLQSQERVSSIAFSNDGKQLFSGHIDGTLTVWDVEKKEKLKELHGDTEIHSIIHHPKKGLLTQGPDLKMHIWNLENDTAKTSDWKRSLKFLKVVNNSYYHLTKAPNGIAIWDQVSHKQLFALPFADKKDLYFSFGPNTTVLAVNNTKITIWDYLEEKTKTIDFANLLSSKSNSRKIKVVALSPDEATLSIVFNKKRSNSYCITIFDIETETLIGYFPTASSPKGLAWHPHEPILACAHNSEIDLIDIRPCLALRDSWKSLTLVQALFISPSSLGVPTKDIPEITESLPEIIRNMQRNQIYTNQKKQLIKYAKGCTVGMIICCIAYIFTIY